VLLTVLDSVDELPIYEAEWEIIGFDHAHVGGELALQWRLPPMLVECITYHHSIREAQHYPVEAALVHLANTLALMAELESVNTADVSAIDPRAWEVSGLGEDVIEPALREARERIAEVERLFLGN
jgi:HD-like signal output (HDOD) protein